MDRNTKETISEHDLTRNMNIYTLFKQQDSKLPVHLSEHKVHGSDDSDRISK